MKNSIALIIAKKLRGGGDSDSYHDEDAKDEPKEDEGGGDVPEGAEESAQAVIDAIKGGRAKDLAQALYDFHSICGG